MTPNKCLDIIIFKTWFHLSNIATKFGELERVAMRNPNIQKIHKVSMIKQNYGFHYYKKKIPSNWNICRWNMIMTRERENLILPPKKRVKIGNSVAEHSQ